MNEILCIPPHHIVWFYVGASILVVMFFSVGAFFFLKRDYPPMARYDGSGRKVSGDWYSEKKHLKK